MGGRAGYPALAELSSLPSAVVEQLVTLHRLDPAKAASRALAAVTSGTTMRNLRDDVRHLAEGRRKPEDDKRAGEIRRLLDALGEPPDLERATWPRELVFPKPDLLLASKERLLAIGWIGARPDPASAARVSWSIGMAGLVDAVWLVGPRGGSFPHEAGALLDKLGPQAAHVGIATMDDGVPGGAKALRAPSAAPPNPDYRSLVRETLPAAVEGTAD